MMKTKKMKTQNQLRLVDVAREIGAEYGWLYRCICMGYTPVERSIAYTQKDVEVLRVWVEEENAKKVAKAAANMK
jgi:hypothetical protein